MAGTKSPEQTTSSKSRSVYKELSDLTLLLGDAKGEVDRAHTIVGRQQDISEEDWARLRSIVFACADKMRDVETVRVEGVLRDAWRGEWGDLTPGQVIERVVKKELASKHSGGSYAIELFVDAYHQLTSGEQNEVVTNITDKMRELLESGEFEKAKRLNELMNAARRGI